MSQELRSHGLRVTGYLSPARRRVSTNCFELEAATTTPVAVGVARVLGTPVQADASAATQADEGVLGGQVRSVSAGRPWLGSNLAGDPSP
jgi:hypothetical protein